jgi:hypothetical protein
VESKHWTGDDNRDELGVDPMACDECEHNPCRCETHCVNHGKPLLVDSFWGVTGGCEDCEKRDEADIPA